MDPLRLLTACFVPQFADSPARTAVKLENDNPATSQQQNYSDLFHLCTELPNAAFSDVFTTTGGVPPSGLIAPLHAHPPASAPNDVGGIVVKSEPLDSAVSLAPPLANYPTDPTAGLHVHPGALTNENAHYAAAAAVAGVHIDNPFMLSDQARQRLERKRARNRLAAEKCRQRKLNRIASLEASLAAEREKTAQLMKQRDQLLLDLHEFRHLFDQHRVCESLNLSINQQQHHG
ncbi:Transcription factor jun-B [Aphelenchoides fujianensis]|nr:Transcription factor jun-B [Aphelenchoides fujianensis]